MKKDYFLQLVQVALCAMAPFRAGGLRSSFSISVGIMACAQTVSEDCLPDNLDVEEIKEFIAHYDPEFAVVCGHDGRTPPRPKWLTL